MSVGSTPKDVFLERARDEVIALSNRSGA